jgi:hypothetical protein
VTSGPGWPKPRATERQPGATGDWISLDTTSISLAAGKSRTITFQVSVPVGAAPGDHVGGIAAQNLQTTTEHRRPSGDKSVGVDLAVNTRLVTAVVIHVAGHTAPRLTLGPPAVHAENGNRQILDLPMSVTGTVFIKPSLTGTLRPCNGRGELARLDQQLDTMVPATTIDYQWPLGPLVLPVGCYTISVTATLGGDVLSQVRGNISITAADSVRPVAARHPQRLGLRRRAIPSSSCLASEPSHLPSPRRSDSHCGNPAADAKTWRTPSHPWRPTTARYQPNDRPHQFRTPPPRPRGRPWGVAPVRRTRYVGSGGPPRQGLDRQLSNPCTVEPPRRRRPTLSCSRRR